MNARVGDGSTILIDGLVVAKWSPEVFAALRAGGLTAINATCAVWENAHETLGNLSKWLQWFSAHDRLICQAKSTADVLTARSTGRTAIILGFQNCSPIEDRIDYLALYKAIGVGVIQLTYNTANYVGSGCYESVDRGLTDFGQDVIQEMNRLGIAVDLSHVGDRTASDAIKASRVPVLFSHVLPRELKEHPRNKSSDQLRAVANSGGLIGVTMFPAFLPKGSSSTVDDYAEIIEWMVNLCGEDHVGIGTDFTQGHDMRFFEWIARDKGTGRWLTRFDPDSIRLPAGINRIEDTKNIADALARRSWPADRIEKVLGLNWLRYLKVVWRE